MDLYLARHGETSYNKQGRTQGHYDARLTERGREQAQKLRDYLRDHDFEAIYASTLLRAYETAEIVAEPHSIKPTAIRDLCEVDRGITTGMTYTEAEQVIEERDETFLDDYDEATGRFRPRLGEDHHDLQERVVPAIQRLIRRNQNDFLIVAHGWVNRVYLASLKGISVAEAGNIPQDNCCINIIDPETDDIRVENYTEHMQ
ncbi:MAG: histidine phosphatase family protein [Candidatus Nanohaloarchaea archaeon]|nr:histidine phosphatase family protein [Candidatus Nanohaloarchaea archaeon]